MVEVKLVAQTVVNSHVMREVGYVRHGYMKHENKYVIRGSENPADELAEFPGRLCYLSWNRPNPATATNQGYLANIIKQDHQSVFGHASFSFYIVCSRACSHEIARHVFLTKSEVSQRYCDPEKILDQVGEDTSYFDGALYQYDQLMDCQPEERNRKAKRGNARLQLPLGFPTALVVSGNVRAWRDFIKQRNTEFADAEIREVAQLILGYLRVHAPNSVQDL